MSDADQKQLLENCRFLEEELSSLKELKLSSAVEVYRYESDLYADSEIEKNIKSIEAAYAQKTKEVQSLYQNNLLKSKKQREQIEKQRMAFFQIIEQIEEKKATIQQEYGTNYQKLTQIKEQNISEWKRLSNDQIKRVSLTGVIGKYLNRKISKKTQIGIMHNKVVGETQNRGDSLYSQQVQEKIQLQKQY